MAAWVDKHKLGQPGFPYVKMSPNKIKFLVNCQDAMKISVMFS